MKLPLLTVAFCHFSRVLAQTYTECDPLQKSCPPNPALGKSIEIDLAKGLPDGWDTSKDIKYDSDGASFTIEKDGMKAEIQSNFYIMFGKVEVTLKSSPGKGIVSSVVLQSECGDEIDLEWIGGDNMQVQTNYYAKRTPDHTRGGFHPSPDNQNTFRTYSIDWDSERIIWKIDGNTVRVAESAGGNYPQTPSYIKIGNWAGGDPAQNAKGTVEWAGGPVDYSLAPFTMQVKSIKIADYSTGKEYVYIDKTGSWKSIKAVDGMVNGHGRNDGTEPSPTTTASTSVSTNRTSSQTSCDPKGSPDATCGSGPSRSTEPTPKGTDPNSGGDRTNGTPTGTNTGTSTGRSTTDPNNPEAPSSASGQSRLQIFVGIGCTLFGALMAAF
ncbi:hypothetical protein ACJ73_00506 [Blastomyces percursus]|uniref:Crh-like protein n=1 Tax=Blastomyces percursus TaxID=1658174 RepID=A0A1J9RHQ0_9EURO|nr:hypothetical protein ACJ73_00506 [Blastomyces percursus]